MFFIHLLNSKNGSATWWSLSMSFTPIEDMNISNNFIPVEPTTHTEDLTSFLGVYTGECNTIFGVICALLNSDKVIILNENSIVEEIESLKTHSSQKVIALINLSSLNREMIVGSILEILKVKP